MDGGYPGLGRLLWVVLGVGVLTQAFAGGYNGFDVEGGLVPPDQILSGGPPRDGIPALDHPRLLEADRADYLSPRSRVLGVAINGEARAYPLAVLNWHEVVNDSIGGEAVVVTYCPLCGTGVVYSALVAGRRLAFGVSGLLYNSDVLLYDRETESLWSQLLSRAVTGPMVGHRLQQLPALLTDWDDWRRRHPDTRVLSLDTGYRRDYGRDPYGGYETSGAVIFPVAFLSRRYHPKERVLGVEYRGVIKAYPFVELARSGATGRLEDELAGEPVEIRYDAGRRAGRIFAADGRELPAVNGYWFAWFAFYPETEVFEAEAPAE